MKREIRSGVNQSGTNEQSTENYLHTPLESLLEQGQAVAGGQGEWAWAPVAGDRNEQQEGKQNLLLKYLLLFLLLGVVQFIEKQQHQQHGKTVKQGKERIASTLRRKSSGLKKVERMKMQHQYQGFCTFHSFNNLLQRQYGSIEFEELASKQALVDQSTYLLGSGGSNKGGAFSYYQVHLVLNILGYDNKYRETARWDSATSFTQILSDSTIQNYFQNSLGALIQLDGRPYLFRMRGVPGFDGTGHSVALRRQGDKWIYMDSNYSFPVSFNTNASMLKYIKQMGMVGIMFVYPRKTRLNSVMNRLFGNYSAFHSLVNPLTKKHTVDIDKTTSQKRKDQYNKDYSSLTEKQKHELQQINFMKRRMKHAPQIVKSLYKRYGHLIF